MSGERFLSRWVRRKSEAKNPAPQAAPLASPPAVPAPPAAPGAPPVDAKAEPPLPPVESLTFDSDFTPFLRPGVDADLKRAAIKSLVRDPRFNVMDGLDVYIDDYSKPDPLPAGWLEKLNQVAWLGDKGARDKAAEEARAAAEAQAAAGAKAGESATGDEKALVDPAGAALPRSPASDTSNGGSEPSALAQSRDRARDSG